MQDWLDFSSLPGSLLSFTLLLVVTIDVTVIINWCWEFFHLCFICVIGHQSYFIGKKLDNLAWNGQLSSFYPYIEFLRKLFFIRFWKHNEWSFVEAFHLCSKLIVLWRWTPVLSDQTGIRILLNSTDIKLLHVAISITRLLHKNVCKKDFLCLVLVNRAPLYITFKLQQPLKAILCRFL